MTILYPTSTELQDRRIAELEAEVERLRVALQRIYDSGSIRKSELIAREALAAPSAVPAPQPPAADLLTVAERTAKAMQEECIKRAQRKPSKGEIFDTAHGRLIALELSGIDAAAIARRAADGDE